jgi:hypothetical protein
VRKLVAAAVAAAVVVVGVSALAFGNAGEAGTSWELTLKPNKVKKSASFVAIVEPSKVDDQGTSDTSDDVWTPASKNTIVTPKQTAIDTSALKRCALTASDVGRGEQCPGKSRAGEGEAKVIVGGTPIGTAGKRQGGSTLNATIEAFNKKSSLLLIVQPCGPGTGPTTNEECDPAGDPTVLEGKWSKVASHPKLAVPTPQSLLQIGVVIQRFELDVDEHSKTVKQNGKEVLKSFALTPEECGGKWKSQDQAKYVDGTSQTIKDTQKCKKP